MADQYKYNQLYLHTSTQVTARHGNCQLQSACATDQSPERCKQNLMVLNTDKSTHQIQQHEQYQSVQMRPSHPDCHVLHK